MTHAKTGRFRALGAAAALVLLGAALWLGARGDAVAVDRPDEIAGGLLPVETLVVELLDGYALREQHAGRVTSRRRSQLGFERGGRLERVLADEGERVAPGQLLAELDTRALRARRRELAAQRDEMEALLALARRTTARQRQLRESDHTPEARLDEAVFEERALEARLAAARAALESVDVQLALSRIEAPYAGTVTARHADEGSVVSPGQPLLEMLEDGAMEVRVGMPPDTAAALAPGESFAIEVGGLDLPGRLHATLPAVEADTRTVTAIFRLAPEVASVADGSLARLSVERRVEETGFWVPLEALAESRRGLWSVYVVSAERGGVGSVERRQLEVIHAEADRAFVRGTLRDGERVVAGGAHRLVPGQRVRVLR